MIGLPILSPPAILHLGKTNKAGRQRIEGIVPMPYRDFPQFLYYYDFHSGISMPLVLVYQFIAAWTVDSRMGLVLFWMSLTTHMVVKALALSTRAILVVLLRFSVA
jgi:hypothetical protein